MVKNVTGYDLHKLHVGRLRLPGIAARGALQGAASPGGVGRVVFGCRASTRACLAARGVGLAAASGGAGGAGQRGPGELPALVRGDPGCARAGAGRDRGIAGGVRPPSARAGGAAGTGRGADDHGHRGQRHRPVVAGIPGRPRSRHGRDRVAPGRPAPRSQQGGGFFFLWWHTSRLVEGGGGGGLLKIKEK